MHACWHRLGPDQRQPSRASTDARSPAPSEPRPAPTGPQPTVTRSQGARHTAPPPAPLGLRFRALLGLGFVPPPEPQPCAHCASIAYALLPAARIPLYRHRADPESSSRSLPSGSPARLARIAPTACRHPHPSMSPPSRSRAHRPPHRAHRAPTSASRPISLLALRRPQGPDWQEPHRMHPFFAECAKRPSSWQHPPEMHAFRDQDGNILAPCIHFRAQSGDSGYMARESCRQGPFSRRGARNHAWREDVASAARPFRGSGMQSGRTGFAPCGAGLACLPHAPPLPSRPRSSPPSYTRRASPSETRHAVPVPMHLATCAPHPSRQPRGPTASRKQAEQRKQLNAGIKIGSPNGDPIEEFFCFAQRLPDALQPLHQANELALSYLDHSTRQRLGGYVISLSGNSFTVDLYAALVDHATSIAC